MMKHNHMGKLLNVASIRWSNVENQFLLIHTVSVVSKITNGGEVHLGNKIQISAPGPLLERSPRREGWS